MPVVHVATWPDQISRDWEFTNQVLAQALFFFFFPACKMVILTCEGWLRETTKMKYATQSQASRSIFKDYRSISKPPKDYTSESRGVKETLHSLTLTQLKFFGIYVSMWWPLFISNKPGHCTLVLSNQTRSLHPLPKIMTNEMTKRDG